VGSMVDIPVQTSLGARLVQTLAPMVS